MGGCGVAASWLEMWQEYKNRTGKNPSEEDPDSRSIYLGVLYGARMGLSGYRDLIDPQPPNQKANWLALWREYILRTGKRPSQRDPDSKSIYYGVYYGAKKDLPGYRDALKSVNN